MMRLPEISTIPGELIDHMVEHDPFTKSQLASRNQRQGFVWCKFGHVALKN